MASRKQRPAKPAPKTAAAKAATKIPARTSEANTAAKTAGAKVPTKGMRQGLATYGDAGFSLFLRKAFIKAGG